MIPGRLYVIDNIDGSRYDYHGCVLAICAGIPKVNCELELWRGLNSPNSLISGNGVFVLRRLGRSVEELLEPNPDTGLTIVTYTDLLKVDP